MDWNISPKCVCKAGGYALDEYSVSGGVEVHMVGTAGAAYDWARRAESDHVADLLKWLNSGARSVAQNLENQQRNETFSSKGECQSVNYNLMQNSLWGSASAAFKASSDQYDVSGQHSYGGPNARP